MKPLPSEEPFRSRRGDTFVSSLPSHSGSNRRLPGHPAHRAYPVLLFLSTALAAVFCLMYITKPVILPAPPSGETASAPSTPAPEEIPAGAPSALETPPLLPDAASLPGESSPAPHTGALPRSASPNAFEETNLSVQHVLNAETPGGDISRIILDVPVLYQTRNLRWTQQEAAEARALLTRLGDYQEKSRELRLEGLALLQSWNSLVERSIPGADLRADSPSLPANQLDAATAPRPAGLDSTDAIQLQPAGK